MVAWIGCSGGLPRGDKERLYHKQPKLLGKTSSVFFFHSREVTYTLRLWHVNSTERHAVLCVGMGRGDRRFLRNQLRPEHHATCGRFEFTRKSLWPSVRAGRPQLSQEWAISSYRGLGKTHGVGVIFEAKQTYASGK